MKGKLKCVVALLLCMTMVFGTNLSTLADTNTAVPQTVQVQETEQTAQEGETAQTTGEQQQTQETQETSSGETQTQEETKTKETQGEQTTQTKEEQTVQEEEKTEQKTAQTPESQGETKAQTDEEESAEVKEETAETEESSEEKQAADNNDTNANENQEEVEFDVNSLSAKELYEYLESLTSNYQYREVWESLTDAKKEELNEYLKEAFPGEVYKYDTNANNFVNAADAKILLNEIKEKSTVKKKTAKANVDSQNFGSTNTEESEGLEINKSITEYDSETGTGKLNLEAYVTGDVATGVRIPVDIVLVLDQSGSMDEEMSEYEYQVSSVRTNIQAYDESHNNGTTYYYKTTDTEDYREVLIERTQNGNQWEQYDTSWVRLSGLYDRQQALYIQVGEEKYSLVIERTGRGTYRDPYRYKVGYTSKDGSVEYLVNNLRDQRWSNIEEISGYTLWTNAPIYEYVYMDAETGKALSDVKGTDMDRPPITLYEYTESGTIKKRDALKQSVTTFVNQIKKDANENKLSHRIAIAGFGSEPEKEDEWWADGNDGYGNNTEVLTVSGSNSGTVGKKYYDLNPTIYSQALVDCNAPIVNQAINALASNGGTAADYGMDMAKEIIRNRQITTVDVEGKQYERPTIVVMFTDGEPTYGNSFSGTVADRTINNSYDLKQGLNVNDKKLSPTTVYSIGVFDGADAESLEDETNRYMQAVSSNYLKATGHDIRNNMGERNPALKEDESYYLSADNSEDLNKAFISIAEGVGGASVELDETTVMQDVLSEYFTLPENANASNITWEVYQQTQNDGWEKVQNPRDDVQIEIVDLNGEGKTIHVTGFDYSEHYVAADHLGQKLVISVPIQYVPEASFGGNDIPTNGATSGIYNADGSLCLGNFGIPTVNHPIDYKIASQDKAIYITNPTNLADLLTYADGYTPNGIKNKFVKITYSMRDAQEALLGTLTIDAGQSKNDTSWVSADQNKNLMDVNLADCSRYKITCKVEPISDGENAFNKDEKETIKEDFTPERPTVHVLIPDVKTRDKIIFLGDTINLSGNELKNHVVSPENWVDMHQHEIAGITREGTTPTLTYNAEFVEDSEENSPPQSLEAYAPSCDSNFTIGVLANNQELLEGQYQVTNESQIDDDDCYNPFDNVQQEHDFTIHVVAGEIQISKILNKADDRNPDLEGDPIFTFKIAGNGNVWYRSVKLGQNETTAKAEILKGLPKGEYTITELPTIRYENTGVEVKNNIPHKSTGTNEVTVCIGYTSTEDPTTNIKNRIGQVEFQNTRKESSKLTDSDISLNRFTKSGDTWGYKEIKIPQKPNQNN